MARVVQATWDVHQQKGWPGQHYLPVQPHAYDWIKFGGSTGPISTNGNPGDAVIYDASNNVVAVPNNAASEQHCIGMIAYDRATVQSFLASAPTGANSDAFVEYDTGDFVKVMIMGTLLAIAQEDMEYGDRLYWHRGTSGKARGWHKFSTTAIPDENSVTVSDLRTWILEQQFTSFTCASPEPVASGDLFPVRIGYGRVF